MEGSRDCLFVKASVRPITPSERQRATGASPKPLFLNKDDHIR